MELQLPYCTAPPRPRALGAQTWGFGVERLWGWLGWERVVVRVGLGGQGSTPVLSASEGVKNRVLCLEPTAAWADQVARSILPRLLEVLEPTAHFPPHAQFPDIYGTGWPDYGHAIPQIGLLSDLLGQVEAYLVVII